MAKIPETSFPAAALVSLAAALPDEHFQPDAAGGQIVDGIDQVDSYC
jgi:hypothetical protein